MPLFEREVDVLPEPFALCRALAGRSHVVLTWLGDVRTAYLACDPVEQSTALDPEPTLALAESAEPHAQVPRWFGVLPYEAFRGAERHLARDTRPLPHLVEPLWLRYGAVAEISDRVRVIGDDLERVRALAALLRVAPKTKKPKIYLAEPLEDSELHVKRIERALELITRGEVYEVNLARRFSFLVQASAALLLEAQSARGLSPFSAALTLPKLDVSIASPELFLELSPDRRVVTSPIKGTRPRGRNRDEDAELARELDMDPKEQAELVMVIDVERNDLGRVARPGSVVLSKPPHIETHATVHHRVATVEAQLRPEIDRTALLSAMLPSGSITGAPKVRAMEVIAELEPHRRGLYTGAFGALRHNGGLMLGMAIRTLSVEAGVGHYFAGGGIVSDSVPLREVEETLWKARQLLDLL
jgi:anthranilate/para-aminobenzoate synthase component I